MSKGTTQNMMHDFKSDELDSKKQPRKADADADLELQNCAVPKAISHADYKELEEKLKQVETQLNAQTAASEELKDKLLQSHAELDNIRKRAAKDVTNAHKYALDRIVGELLPVVDSLERGLSIETGDNEFAKRVQEGLEMTLSVFLSTLKRFNVTQIDPVNETLDPALHQVVSMQENSGLKPNAVVQVLQKGYLLNDRLIRPALVVVSK